MFFGDFGCFPTGPNVVPKNRKLVPDWIPTGSRLDPDWPKAVPKNAKIGARLGPDWVPTGSRLGPDWVPTGSRPGFFKKTPISLNLSTYFWNFSTLPCTTPPPPDPPPPTSLKPNTGLATLNQHFHIKSDSEPTCSVFIYIYTYIYIYPCVAYVINHTGHGGGPPKAVRHGRPSGWGPDRNLQKKNMFVMCIIIYNIYIKSIL